jgi:hypothetical protein
MEAHSDEVIAECAGVHAMVEALEPAPGFLIVVNLMFGSTALSLLRPMLEEAVLIEHVTVSLRPFSESLPAGAVHRRETA